MQVPREIAGVNIRIVAAKAGYLAALLVGWATSTVIVDYLLKLVLSASDASFYALIATAAKVFVALFFLAWMRHVYRSEGGKAAALGLAISGLSVALVGVLVANS